MYQFMDYYDDLCKMTAFFLKRHIYPVKVEEYHLEMVEAFNKAVDTYDDSQSYKFENYLMTGLRFRLIRRYHLDKRADFLRPISLHLEDRKREGDLLIELLPGPDKSEKPFDYIDIEFTIDRLKFSDRDGKILKYVIEGYTLKDISHKLNISVHMTRNYYWPDIKQRLQEHLSDSETVFC